MIAVAHLDHSLEPGGAELALARLIEEDPGWTPRLFVPRTKTPGSNAFARTPGDLINRVGMAQTAGAINSGPLSQLAIMARASQFALALRARRSFRESEVVHANTSRAAAIGWLACVGSDRRLVVHLRDAIDVSALGSRNTKLLTLILSKADGVIANSRYTLESAAPFVIPRTPTRVIPSPIGLPTQRSVKPVKERVEVIGMLARITPWKGQELLLRAFADAFRDSQITLEFAGSAAFGQDGHLEHLRRLAVELGIEAKVRFLGHVSDIWRLIDEWDICVHASLHSEPLGQNVLQYLAACRPTIAANAGGPMEWIESGQTGLLFEPGNQAALRLALTRLVSDHHLRISISEQLAVERPAPTDKAVRQSHQEFFESVAAS